MPTNITEEGFLKPSTVHEIKSEIPKFNLWKSPGDDNIGAKIIMSVL